MCWFVTRNSSSWVKQIRNVRTCCTLLLLAAEQKEDTQPQPHTITANSQAFSLVLDGGAVGRPPTTAEHARKHIPYRHLYSHYPLVSLQLDRTALQWAAANGHIEIIQLLIDAGADVEAQDKVRGAVARASDCGAGDPHCSLPPGKQDSPFDTHSPDAH